MVPARYATQIGLLATRFVIGHERPIALILFILSILLGFPIGAILGIVLIIPQLILLGLLHCLGWTSDGVERGTFDQAPQVTPYSHTFP
jgi:hypothetical protein